MFKVFLWSFLCNVTEILVHTCIEDIWPWILSAFTWMSGNMWIHECCGCFINPWHPPWPLCMKGMQLWAEEKMLFHNQRMLKNYWQGEVPNFLLSSSESRGYLLSAKGNVLLVLLSMWLGQQYAVQLYFVLFFVIACNCFLVYMVSNQLWKRKNDHAPIPGEGIKSDVNACYWWDEFWADSCWADCCSAGDGAFGNWHKWGYPLSIAPSYLWL